MPDRVPLLLHDDRVHSIFTVAAAEASAKSGASSKRKRGSKSAPAAATATAAAGIPAGASDALNGAETLHSIGEKPAGSIAEDADSFMRDQGFTRPKVHR